MSIRRIVPLDQAQWSVAPPPLWRLPREIDWRQQAPAEEAVAWLLLDEQHHVASQACTRRWVRQLLSISAVQGLSQVELEFEPDSQRLIVHELVVWRLDADGAWRKRTPVAAESLLLRQREQQLEQQMLNGRVSLVALLEDVRVGDVLDLAWTLEPRERLPGLAFTSYFAFAWRAPVAQACVTLHLAGEAPVRWKLHPGGDGPLPEERADADRVEWSQRALPRFEGEDNVPGSHWHWPLLEVSGWTSWQEVARFVSALWAEAIASDGEAIAAEAAQLGRDLAPEQAILAAIRFVQEEVRYLAVDLGHGAGLLPNAVGTVLRRRFGDCKDKTVLLTALLRALGVAARPVLVASQWREAVARLMPSVYAFDHVIVGFEWQGTLHFVDPTCIGQRGDLAHRVPPPYGVGLEVAPQTMALVELPPTPPTGLMLTECFDLDRRGRGRVGQSLRVDGGFADDLRASLLRDGRQAFAKTRADALQQHFPALAADPAATRFDDDVQANTLVMEAAHALPSWGKPGDKPPPTFNYGAHGLLLGLDVIDARETRRQPWALRHPMTLHHRVVVRGRCVKKVQPSRFDYSGPGFRYRCEVQAERHEVRFDYIWETTERAVAAEDWRDYCSQRSTALDRTGALVHTQGMSFGFTPRVAIVCFVALLWGTHLFQRLVNHRPAPHASLDRVAVERDASEAFKAMSGGDAARAYALLAPHKGYYGENFQAQIVLGESATLTGHLAEAEAALARARQLKPGHHQPDMIEAYMLEQRGDFVGARRLLEAAVIKTGVDVKAFVDLARVTERDGDRVAARAAWGRLLEREPAHPEGLYGFAHLLWLAGERARADELIVGAVRAQPTASAALEGALARYYAATGRRAQALDAAQRAATLAPDDVPAVRQYAMAQMNAGEREAAVTTARGMTTRFPADAQAWSALAIAAAVAGRLDAAEPAFARWIDLAPNDPEATSSLGYFLHIKGDDARAREVLADGAKRFPAYGNLWLNYAVVLEALHDPAAADARRKAAILMTPEQRATLAR